MACFPPEDELCCSVCRRLFEDPVLLQCSHSFCKACVDSWWTLRGTSECPLCRRRSPQTEPPRNLALRNLCEAYAPEGAPGSPAGSPAAGLCRLHAKRLGFFCLDHREPVCAVCRRSDAHRNHAVKPVQEAALDYRAVLRELLKPVREKLELFEDIRGNFDQTSKDVDAQARDAERQIRDVFSTLHQLLQEEEEERVDAVRREKTQKSRTMKTESDALSRRMTPLSDSVRTTEELLGAPDLSFLQSYRTTAEKVQDLQLSDPQPLHQGLIHMSEHLDRLAFKALDSVRTKVASSQSSGTVGGGSAGRRSDGPAASARESPRGFEDFRTIRGRLRPTNPDPRRRSMVADSRLWGLDNQPKYP